MTKINLCEPGRLWSKAAQDWAGRKPADKAHQQKRDVHKGESLAVLNAACEAGR